MSGLTYVSNVPAQTSRHEAARKPVRVILRVLACTQKQESAEVIRKSLFVGGIAAAVVIVGAIVASSDDSSTATASVATPPPTASATNPPAPAASAPVTVPSSAPAKVEPRTTTVTSVVDGDTVETTDSTGAKLTIRIIGIDAPEMGSCEGAAAAVAMSAIALNHPVTLQLGGDGEDLDKYGRSLRFVDVTDTSIDAGLNLIQQGHAIARYDSRDGYGRHTREDAYIAADAAAPDYLCTPAPIQEPAPAADPNENHDTDVSVAPDPAPAPEPAPAAEPQPESAPAPAPQPAAAPAPSAYYANCDAARAAGAAPLYAGQPGYSTKLDRDKDGVACE